MVYKKRISNFIFLFKLGNLLAGGVWALANKTGLVSYLYIRA